MKTSRLTVIGATIVLGATVVGACASGGSSVLSQTELTSEQLSGTTYATVYDFLRAHSRARIRSGPRGEFLTVYRRSGGMRSVDQNIGEIPGFGEGSPPPQTLPADQLGEAMLYVNEQEVRGGIVQTLQQMSLSNVRSLQILRPSEASARYGGDGMVGAVVIITKDYET